MKSQFKTQRPLWMSITYSDCLILHHCSKWRLREDSPFVRDDNISEPQISCSMQTYIHSLHQKQWRDHKPANPRWQVKDCRVMTRITVLQESVICCVVQQARRSGSECDRWLIKNKGGLVNSSRGTVPFIHWFRLPTYSSIHPSKGELCECASFCSRWPLKSHPFIPFITSVTCQQVFSSLHHYGFDMSSLAQLQQCIQTLWHNDLSTALSGCAKITFKSERQTVMELVAMPSKNQWKRKKTIKKLLL